MDTTAITHEKMKAKCTHCGYEFDEPVPILSVYSKAPEDGKFVHNVCPKCLYIDTIEIKYEKRDVPLDWKEFEKSAEEHAKQEQEMYNKLFAKHALSYFRNPSGNCISYIFNDERYGKNTVDMLIMDILVYLEHREMARRFANLDGLDEAVKQLEIDLKADLIINGVTTPNIRSILTDFRTKIIRGNHRNVKINGLIDKYKNQIKELEDMNISHIANYDNDTWVIDNDITQCKKIIEELKLLL